MPPKGPKLKDDVSIAPLQQGVEPPDPEASAPRDSTRKHIEDLTNPDSRINKIFSKISFVETELDREELDGNETLFTDFIFQKSPEIQEYIDSLPEADRADARERITERIKKETYPKWKEGHKMYCAETAKLLIDNGKEVVDEMKFVEEELDREELDDADEKLLEFLLKKSPELAEFRKQLGGKALKKFDEEVMGKAKLKWKEGHKVYCPETAKLTIKEGTEISKGMKFSEQELSRDELHDSSDELKKFLLQKDGLGELRDGLRGKALKKFDEEVTEPLMKRWNEEHEAYEFRVHQKKILARAQKGEIPADICDRNLEEAVFISRYFDALADQEDELKEAKHADIRKKLSEDPSIIDAIKGRYTDLQKGAKLEEVKGEIDQAIKGIHFTPEEVGEDAYHDDPDAFVEAFKDRIGDELLAKMETMGANKETGKTYLLQQLKEVLYPRWKDQHEAHEIKEKEEAMLEKLQGNIPPEIAAENLKKPDFLQKLFDHYANEDGELKDPKHANLRQKLFDKPAVKAALQGRQQEYQEVAAERLTGSLKSDVEALTFSETEYKEEKYHTDLKAFGEYVVNGKLSPELLKQLDFLDADKKKTVLENLAKHAQDKLHPDWQKNHKALEEKEMTDKILASIEQGEISDDFQDPPLPASEFGERYLTSILESTGVAFDEPHHQGMKERILKSDQVRSALTKKHQAYWEELKSSTRAEMEKDLQKMKFTEQERDNDEFHNNPSAFADAMQEKLSEKLRSRLRILDCDGTELTGHMREQLENEVYQCWLKQHESAEEKKFIDELTEKIGSEPITPDFAQEHYEENEFRQAWYERIAEKLSPELREEHQEVIEGLLQKDRVQEAFKAKFQEYEPIHEKVLEEQFTGELAELMRSVNIPEEMLQQDLPQTEFIAKYYGALLSHASPKMREELEEHPQLQQALLGKRELQTGLQQRYDEFQKLREKKQLEEATKESIALLQQHPIPAAILAKGVDSPEFQQHLFELLQSRLSPELRKVLAENKAFRELLLKQQTLQHALKQTHQENRDQASKANTTKGEGVIQHKSTVSGREGKALEAQKESVDADDSDTDVNKKEAEGVSDQEIEVLTSSPLGQQRLDSLRQSFGLRTLLRRREQFFTVFLQKWLSTISDYEFRNFSRLVRKKGTTPQQIIAAMTTNSHRKIRLQKLKFLNQSDWRRFTQGLQYIKVKPEDLVAGRLSIEPATEQHDKTSEAATQKREQLRTRVDELFEQQQPSEGERWIDPPSFDEEEQVIMDEQETTSEDTDEWQIEPVTEMDELLQERPEPPVQMDDDLTQLKEPVTSSSDQEKPPLEADPVEELHQPPDEEPVMEIMPQAGSLQEQIAEILAEPPAIIEEVDAISEPIDEEDHQPAQAEIAMDGPQEEVVEAPLSDLQAESASQEPMSEFLPEKPLEEEIIVQEKEPEAQAPQMMDDLVAPEAEADEQVDLEEQMQRVVMGIDQEQRSLRLLTRQFEETMRVLRTIDGEATPQKIEMITWVAERLRRGILLELMQQIGKKQSAHEQLSELLYRYQLLMLRLADEEGTGSIEDDQGGVLRQRIMLGTLLNRFLFAIRLQSHETYETSISIDSTCLGASVVNADDVYADLWQHYEQVLKEQTKIAHIAISHGKEVGYGESRSIILKIQYASRTERIIEEKSIPYHLEEERVWKTMPREIPQAA